MSEFHTNAKVVCVDATPLPINVSGAVRTEFSFPGGFLEEGAVYCVTRVSASSDGNAGLFLAGIQVIYRGFEIAWNSQRFRLVHSRGVRCCLSDSLGAAESAPTPGLSPTSIQATPS